MEAHINSLSQSLQRSFDDKPDRFAIAERRIREAEERQRLSKRSALITAANLPKRHMQADITELDDSPELAAKRRKLHDAIRRGAIVGMVGNRGTGKTQEAVLAAKDFITEELRGARYVKAVRIGMAVRESFGKPGGSETAAIDEWVRPQLLIVDDVHELRDDKEYDRVIFTLLCDMRYDDAKPTILVANVTPEQSGKLFGASIADRINDGGGLITFNGPSKRQ